MLLKEYDHETSLSKCLNDIVLYVHEAGRGRGSRLQLGRVCDIHVTPLRADLSGFGLAGLALNFFRSVM